MKKFLYKKSALRGVMMGVLIMALLAAATAVASEADTFAEQLVRLRAEVEELSNQLDDKKTELQARLRSTSNQRADLQMHVQREELRLKQLQQARDRQRERVALARQAEGSVEPQVLESIAILREVIAEGLPFQVPQRLAELDKLELQIKEGTLSAPRASARLWQVAEDNLRLTRESGLYRQVIILDGEENLAEVARLGMVAMYFMTGDGRVGTTHREGDSWTYRVLTDRDDQKQVMLFFDALKKQIRVGHFTLPNAFLKEMP